jgi:hypothetical protein
VSEPLAPPAPPPIIKNAILVLPAGTVYVPPALNVAESAYTIGTTGVTLPDEEDAELATPDEEAVTVKVYAVPLLNPVTVNGELAPEAVNPPGELVTV